MRARKTCGIGWFLGCPFRARKPRGLCSEGVALGYYGLALRAECLLTLVLLIVCSLSTVWGATPGQGQIVTHPSLDVKLFASEPDIVDPVALTFDETVKMYVVEMRDYPLGMGPDHKPGGTIRVLEDRDGDGRADHSTIFATDLRFPTSIAPWKGGVFVTAPPEIIYLKDTNGDNIADVREVYFDGFTLGVTDSNLNGLRWGLDNRIHGCNGGNGGNVRSLKKPGPPVDIQNADWSFDPETGDFQTTYQTSGGFGLVFDIWGRSFTTYNIDHIQQRVIPLRYMRRFPGLPPVGVTTNISDHGDMAQIYQISVPETRVNHPEQSGHFSSAGGLGYIGHPAYGSLFGCTVVGDVVANLMHRDVLEPNGPIFRAHRALEELTSEFLASTDNSSRFTGLELGPDGALYVIDMQRDVIEHPDYIPEKAKAKLNLRAGEDRGRIYRIMPKGVKTLGGKQRNLAEQALSLLSDSNQWVRITAQRLLIEKHEKAAVKGLKSLISDGKSQGAARLHALWTLQGLNELEEGLCEKALADTLPEIRENALVLSEPFLANSAALKAKVIALLNDPSPRVRFQAALTTGEIRSSAVIPALAELFAKDGQYHFTRIAVLSSTFTNAQEILSTFLQNTPKSADHAPEALRELTDLIAGRAESDPNGFAEAFETLASSSASNEWKIACLEGFLAGVERTGAKIEATKAMPFIEKLSELKTPELFAAAWKLSRRLNLPDNTAQQKALATALKTAADNSLPPEQRVSSIHILELGTYAEVTPILFSIFEESAPAELQSAALKSLAVHRNPALAKKIVDHWQSFSPALRPNVLNLILSRVPWHDALMSAIESGKISIGELNLDLEQRRTLLRDSTPEIQRRAAKFIGDEEYSNRKAVVEEFLPKLPPTGDALHGREVFVNICAQCHQLAGVGSKVGPDLTSVVHRSVEDIASNILDPNMAINPNYISFTAQLNSGDLESGILATESPDSITLLQAQEKRVVIARKEIKHLRSSGISLMPEGLDKVLTPADLRDVIAFIQAK
jgi:putative membrane-bound dehydrogenase-like protein